MPQSSIEDRIRRLEDSRYKIVGQLNAHKSLLLTALATVIQRSTSPSSQVLAELAAWIPSSPRPQKIFHGIDPSEFAAFQQEYETSIAGLLAELEAQVNQPK